HSEIVATLHSIPTGETVLDDENLDDQMEVEAEEEIADLEVDDLETEVDLIDEAELEEESSN
ncbi:MAG: hypothetical protein ACO25L_06740, partial [Candidatus Nanopelagicales bacterium]